MATEFKLPELGEGVDSAEVARILVSEGDMIEADDHVMELQTEKAVADLPCPHAGKVAQLHVSEGDTVEVGQLLMTLEEVEAEQDEEKPPKGGPEEDEQAEAKEAEAREDEEKQRKRQEEAEAEGGEPAAEAAEEARARKESKEEEEEAAGEREEEEPEEARAGTAGSEEREVEEAGSGERAEQESGRERTGRDTTGNGKHRIPPPAGPATRRLARKLHVDLDELRPGEGGRITQEDVVRAYVESERAPQAAAEPLPDFRRFGPVERQPLGKVSRVSLQRLSQSWRTIPHVTQHGLADITDLDRARREYNKRSGDASAKITMTAIAIKISVAMLREFPRFNASLDAEAGELVLKHYYHIGTAIDTDQGLIVAVIRDADRKSIEEIATDVANLAERARNHRLQREDMEGGSFTISNQGSIGGDHFTPIVNYPEVAILGIGQARRELRMIEGEIQQRLLLPLSLSYDHRAINGADAARFMARMTPLFSDAFTMLVEC